jgi:hypothetical protein
MTRNTPGQRSHFSTTPVIYAKYLNWFNAASYPCLCALPFGPGEGRFICEEDENGLPSSLYGFRGIPDALN